MSDNVVRLGPQKCPVCTRPRHPGFRPFCSKRCADVDLGRWFSGVFAIPVELESDDETERPRDGDDGGDDPYL